jgi:hypothetical protein
MNVLPGDLTSAGLSARDRLDQLARGTAATGLRAGQGGLAAAMGAAARAAVFTDALIGAIRARLEELRMAAK